MSRFLNFVRRPVLSSYSEFRTMDKVEKPSDSIVMHHLQNSLDSTVFTFTSVRTLSLQFSIHSLF
jgi:hypothetical protein